MGVNVKGIENGKLIENTENVKNKIQETENELEKTEDKEKGFINAVFSFLNKNKILSLVIIVSLLIIFYLIFFRNKEE